MAEIRTVTTLTKKRDQIERTIVQYERQLAQARSDLAHIKAALTIFIGGDEPRAHRVYVDLRRVFAYGEIGRLCIAELANAPLTTREIATALLARKGLDTGDKVLAKTIAHSVVHSMRGMALRRKVRLAGKRANVSVWALP